MLIYQGKQFYLGYDCDFMGIYFGGIVTFYWGFSGDTMWVSNQAFYGNTIWDMIRGLKPTILWVVIRNDLLEYLWFLHVLMGFKQQTVVLS